MSRERTFLLLGMLCLSLLALYAPGGANGQEPASTSAGDQPGDVATEAASRSVGEVIARLEDLVADNRRYRDMLSTASSEDSLVLRLQIESTQETFTSEFRSLAQLVSAPGRAGLTPELSAQVSQIYVLVTARVWELIADKRREIDHLRARRARTPPSGQSSLESAITRATRQLDRQYEFAAFDLKVLMDFGLDVEADQATFTRLLNERAEELSGRISLDLLRIKERRTELKEKPGDEGVTQLLSAAKRSLDSNATSLEVTLRLMDSLGIPNEPYRLLLVSVTRDLASGVFDIRVGATMLRKAYVKAVNWLKAEGPKYFGKLLLFVGILALGRGLAALVSRALNRMLMRSKAGISRLLRRTLVAAAGRLIMLLALLLGLSQFGVSLTPMLAGLGVVGFILGFAMQDSLSNFAAGMMILFYRPYDVGDMVEIGGAFGKVDKMNMVSSTILTVDNQKLVVPNGKIWGEVIKNVTDQKIRRVDMTFGISYRDDVPKAEKVLTEILTSDERVLKEPAPMVRLHALGESSVDFVVRPWVKTSDYWDVYWDVTRSVKLRFDQEGISIPFPQRDVHIYEERKSDRSAGREGSNT